MSHETSDAMSLRTGLPMPPVDCPVCGPARYDHDVHACVNASDFDAVMDRLTTHVARLES